MIFRVAALGLALCLVAPASGWGQETYRDMHIPGYRGPYRGQVIDADTRKPLVGAVVVAMWTRDRIYPFHSVNERYAVREVLTDSEGRFVLDAKDVEEGAPKRTRYPEFRIFLPGYGAFPGFQRAPLGYTGGIFQRPGTIVELARLEDRQQQIRNLHHIEPGGFTERPLEELPLLVRAYNEERRRLGFDR
jgi:hypothetical protein